MLIPYQRRHMSVCAHTNTQCVDHFSIQLFSSSSLFFFFFSFLLFFFCSQICSLSRFWQGSLSTLLYMLCMLWNIRIRIYKLPLFSTTFELGRPIEIMTWVLLWQVAISKQSSSPVFRKSKWRKLWSTDEGSQVHWFCTPLILGFWSQR